MHNSLLIDLHLPVFGDRRRDERAPETMFQITVQNLRHPRSLANAIHVETKRSATTRSPGLHRRVRRGVEREGRRNDCRNQEVVDTRHTSREAKRGPFVNLSRAPQRLRSMAEILPRSDHMEKIFKSKHSQLYRRVYARLGIGHGL